MDRLMIFILATALLALFVIRMLQLQRHFHRKDARPIVGIGLTVVIVLTILSAVMFIVVVVVGIAAVVTRLL